MKHDSLTSKLKDVAHTLDSFSGSYISCKGTDFPIIASYLHQKYIIYYDDFGSKMREALMLMLESDSVFFDKAYLKQAASVRGFKGSMSSDKELFYEALKENFSNHKFVFFPKEISDEKIFHKTSPSVSLDVIKGCSYDKLIDFLKAMGFCHSEFVEEPFQFARRGLVVDFYPKSYKNPLRAVFNDGVCSSLFSFDVKTQLIKEEIDRFVLIKLEEINTKVSFSHVCSGLNFKHIYCGNDYISFGENKKLKKIPFSVSSIKLNEALKKDSSFFIDLPIPYGVEYQKKYYKPVWCKNREVITDVTSLSLDFSKLNKGDFLVHEDFGVGKYRGLISVDGYERVVIEYEGGKINVYPSFFSKISLFKKKGDVVNLDSLNKKSLWKKRLGAAKRQAMMFAEDLIRTYVERKNVSSSVFISDGQLENSFIRSFKYKDTRDQEVVWSEIKKDLESPTPMDRLVCGDVGFGKTELSIRAAFLAAINGKKTLVLAPTTILANQLFISFNNRLSPYGVVCECLTRLTKKSAVKGLVENYVEGAADVLISTHRAIFNKKILEKSSLVIVDDEHKFGVTQKEAAKKINSSVNMLYMSATPIPRTLEMALSNITSISNLTTPPLLKKDTETYVDYFDDNIIKKAVMSEVLRGGQVFFIHNKVQTINSIKQYLQKLFPSLNIDVLHGQMNSGDIKSALARFLSKRTDVLVASSIVESGVDIPSVNTIIINNAHLLGVSQLYQMRGRVGRSSKSSFAYLLIPKNINLTQDSKNRLKIIEKNSSLGSCFSVALEDLNTRGGGAIFGYSQTGSRSNVGFDLYNSFIEKAINDKTGNVKIKCSVVSYLKPYVPDDYIPSSKVRVWLYKEISLVSDLKNITPLRDKIINRFGPIPAELEILFFLKKIELTGSKCFFHKIIIKKDFIDMSIDTFFWKNKIDSLISALFGYKFILIDGGNVIRIYITVNTILTVLNKLYNGIKND